MNKIDAQPLGPVEQPLPMGVEAESGQLLPGLTPNDLQHIDADPNAVQARGASDNTDFLAVSDVDPNKLNEAGWGIIFPRDPDPAVRAALEPLIEHRRKQVSDSRLFKIFEGATGYQPNDTVPGWLAQFKVGLAVVDPLLGVPLYLLIVGSPEEIPFEFQYLLDAYWSVGRLHFETPAQYRAYAEGVIAYETGATVPHGKRVAVFSTRNPGDRATALLMDQVAVPLVQGTDIMKPLGERQGFQRQSFLGEEATKDNLLSLLQSRTAGPSVLASFRTAVSCDDAVQADHVRANPASVREKQVSLRMSPETAKIFATPASTGWPPRRFTELIYGALQSRSVAMANAPRAAITILVARPQS